MRTLHFAIIGCGRIAQRHAELISNFGRLAAVCDILPARAEEMGNKYNSHIYYSLENLLASEKNIDVLAVCTPNGLHRQHTIAALNAGMHVICEKPMAIHSQDCLEMILAAEHNKKKLFIVKQNRYNPPVTAVKELIDKGIAGKIYSTQLNCFWNRDKHYYENSWRGTKELDGGTLFTQFSHFIDLLYWMFGDLKKVQAFTGNFAHIDCIEFEDTGVAVIEFESGIIGTINFTVNSYKKNMEGSLTIFAEKGTVKIGGQYLNELEYQSIEGYEIKDLPMGNGANNYGTYTGSMSNHDKVYENVVDVLQKGGTITTSAHEGMKTVEIIEKIYRSAEY